MQNSSIFTSNFGNQNYYPFGMVMPGRTFTSESYRYGFNGMEKDGEQWTGNNGSHLDFGARIYDSRLGRWFARDKLAVKYSGISSYAFAGSNPVLFIDPDGLQIVVPKVDDRQPVLNAINKAFGEGFFDFDSQGKLNYTGKGTDGLDPTQKKLFAYFSFINNNDIDTYIRLGVMGVGPFYNVNENGNIVGEYVLRGTSVLGATLEDYRSEELSLPTTESGSVRSASLKESILYLYLESKVEIGIMPWGMQGGIVKNLDGTWTDNSSYDVTLWHELGHAFHKLFNHDGLNSFNGRDYSNFSDGDWSRWTVGFENMYRDIQKLPRATGKGQHMGTPGGEGVDNGYQTEDVPSCPERAQRGCQEKGK